MGNPEDLDHGAHRKDLAGAVRGAQQLGPRCTVAHIHSDRLAGNPQHRDEETDDRGQGSDATAKLDDLGT